MNSWVGKPWTPDHAEAVPQSDSRDYECCKVQVTSSEKADESKAATQTINSSTDKNGNQHPGTAAVKGPSTVTCASASGNDPVHNPPSCYIVAPGYAGIVNKGNTIGTSGAGTVTLTCNGQAPLSCSARIQ